MDGMPVTDLATGKVLWEDPETQSDEWGNSSEAIEDHMNFDKIAEDGVAATTDKERRSFEARYRLPAHFLDDHDHLFRFISFACYLFRTFRRVPASHQSAPAKRLLVHEFMVGKFKDVSLDDFACIFRELVVERPDIAKLLRGEEA